jgi:hypothetical protein
MSGEERHEAGPGVLKNTKLVRVSWKFRLIFLRSMFWPIRNLCFWSSDLCIGSVIYVLFLSKNFLPPCCVSFIREQYLTNSHTSTKTHSDTAPRWKNGAILILFFDDTSGRRPLEVGCIRYSLIRFVDKPQWFRPLLRKENTKADTDSKFNLRRSY